MTGFMTHILDLFSHRDFISVFMRPNINTIETFESSRALTFSVISLEIVLHAYLFIGHGILVYPKLLYSRRKHFFIVRWINLSSAAKIILFTLPPKCKISTRRTFFFLL